MPTIANENNHKTFFVRLTSAPLTAITGVKLRLPEVQEYKIDSISIYHGPDPDYMNLLCHYENISTESEDSF